MTLLKGMLKEGIKTGEFRDINIDDIAELLYSVYVMMIIRTYVKAEGTLNTDSIQRGYDLILHGLLKT